MWSEGQGTPYRGYYNGDVKLMIANGTYADFRPKLEDSAKRGKFSSVGTPEDRIEKSLKKLENWDKEWEKIPVEKRIESRNLVADNAAVREVVKYTARGPQRFLLTEPENNDNVSKRILKKEKKLPQKLPSGSIKRDELPVALTSIK